MFIIFRGYMVIHRSYGHSLLPCGIRVSKKKKKKIPLPPKFLVKVCMRTILVFFCLVCILVVSTFYNKGAFTGNR